MSKLNKHMKGDKKKWILTLVAGGLIVVALASLFMSVGRLDTTEKLNALDYKISAINTTTGNVTDSSLHIVTKNLQKYEDAEIKLNDGATITYKVAFYDDDKDFLGITSSLSANFATSNIPNTITQANIEYFRIEITPAQVDEEDVVVSVLNMRNYTNQLSVVVAK